MPPDLALMLAAVLLAVAEQVKLSKLDSFGVARPEDLTLMQLAMAFRHDDSGLTGDVFEWALLLAINNGDPDVVGLVSEALEQVDLRVDTPHAVLVAAEPGRLVTYSPQLPSNAALATGTRGRPPYVANLLANATTRTWKADLILGGIDTRWVGASLKSNPADLKTSFAQAAGTIHPPRIGITAGRTPGVRHDNETGAVIIDVPAHGPTMKLAKLVLVDVKTSFSRHLSVPKTPMMQDVTGVGLQLLRWQDQTVGYAVDVLLQWASQWQPFDIGHSTSTRADVPDANGALVAVNPIIPASRWQTLGGGSRVYVRSSLLHYGDFDPID